MKRMLTLSRSLLAAAALTLVASSAFAAGGVNLSWNDCGAFGTMQRNFACNTNSGVNTMFASAIAPVPMPQLNGHAGVLDLQTNQATLSSWWRHCTVPKPAITPACCKKAAFPCAAA